MAKIKENDEKIIINFIERESKDYTPNKDSDWVASVFLLVMKRIEEAENCRSVTLNSYGNVGIKTRSLMIKVLSGNMTEDYNIRLCPCGQITHTAMLEDDSNFQSFAEGCD